MRNNICFSMLWMLTSEMESIWWSSGQLWPFFTGNILDFARIPYYITLQPLSAWSPLQYRDSVLELGRFHTHIWYFSFLVEGFSTGSGSNLTGKNNFSLKCKILKVFDVISNNKIVFGWHYWLLKMILWCTYMIYYGLQAEIGFLGDVARSIK